MFLKKNINSRLSDLVDILTLEYILSECYILPHARFVQKYFYIMLWHKTTQHQQQQKKEINLEETIADNS